MFNISWHFKFLQIAYNTEKSHKLLCDDNLHRRLMNVSSISSTNKDNAGDLICIPPDLYIESKVVWTREAAFILCSYEYGLCKFE